ncbi:hypothetical protein CPB86DRAFT_785630 [Serendipita vermifera]|nr:hypothetical protein CPB86DRAFT_785630 [Serendipita vermifera]
MNEGPACRILVVASSKEIGTSLIKRIRKNDEGVDAERIKWAISNKYYDAEVYFHHVPWKSAPNSLEQGIPAVVFVWDKGEDYEYMLGRYTSDWEKLNAEVMLAVATGSGNLETDAAEDFCSEVGFEFIDAGDDDEEGGSDGGGLSRVIEALQTIMWPSMRRKATKTHRSHASIEKSKGPVERAQVSDMEKEKAALETWLESDDPWPKRTTDTAGGLTFDDDFTDFVSAPRDSTATTPAPITPKEATGNKVEDGEKVHDEDEADFEFRPDEDDYRELLDDEMPSAQEILMTSQRLFGRSLASQTDKGEENEEGEDIMGEYDLGSLMAALQSMKEEIADITDEEEKRKAAARVALGLVWGLEGGKGL